MLAGLNPGAASLVRGGGGLGPGPSMAKGQGQGGAEEETPWQQALKAGTAVRGGGGHA